MPFKKKNDRDFCELNLGVNKIKVRRMSDFKSMKRRYAYNHIGI